MLAVTARRETPAAQWCRRSGAFALTLLVTAAAAHRYGLIETPVLFSLVVVVAAVAAFALLMAAIAFRRIWEHDEAGAGDLIVGCVLALVAVTPHLIVAALYLTRPMLVDVSTDLAGPPQLAQAAAERTAGMNPLGPISQEAALRQLQVYPEVTARRYDLAFEQVVDTVRDLIAENGWEFRPASAPSAEGEITIEAKAHTLAVALPVDVAVRVLDVDGATYVDMRSAWRYGRHDLGDNAARISAFLDRLDEEVLRRSAAAPAPDAS